jgi:hypothetical protein
MACGVDGHFRRAGGDRARQLEPHSRGVEPKAERCETIHRFPQEQRRIVAPLGEREATVSSDGEGNDAIAAAALGDDVERGRRRSRVVQPVLGQSCLDQLREQRRSEKVRPTELVESLDEQGGRGSRLASRQTNRHARLYSFRFGLEPPEQLFGFVEPALKRTDLRKPGRRWNAARTLPRGCQLANRLLELGLRCVDPAIGGEDVRAASPAEGEQRHVVVRADELVEHGAPLLGAFAVAGTLAGEHQRAADVREGLEVGGLAARRGSHRLIESSETLVHVAERHFGEPQLS